MTEVIKPGLEPAALALFKSEYISFEGRFLFVDTNIPQFFPPHEALVQACARLIVPFGPDKVTNISLAAVDLVASISDFTGISKVTYSLNGDGAKIDGRFQAEDRVVAIDNRITTGDSAQKAVNNLRKKGLIVEDIFAIIDVGQRAEDRLEVLGINVHTLFRLSQLLEYYKKNDLITPEQHAIAVAQLYLSA